MKFKLDKKTIPIGAGVGIGSAQVYLTDRFLGNFVVFGNMGVGALAVLLGNFGKFNDNLKTFLMSYGFTALIGGIIQGIPSLRLMPVATGRVSTLSYGRNGQITHQYYPGFTGTFVERPATRAQGFGSDVTRNPMAAIPTTIPYNKIIA